jgi:hypothetical protein
LTGAAIAMILKNILNHNILIMVTINILNNCNMSVAMTFNVLELHWGYTIITTITTNSFNITDFELQALQQYNYNISDFKLQEKSVTTPGRRSCNPNPSAATTFQAVSYNSRNRGRYSRLGRWIFTDRHAHRWAWEQGWIDMAIMGHIGEVDPSGQRA